MRCHICGMECSGGDSEKSKREVFSFMKTVWSRDAEKRYLQFKDSQFNICEYCFNAAIKIIKEFRGII